MSSLMLPDEPALYLGQMSGTSLDGVDTVLMHFGAQETICLGTHFLPFSDALRQDLLALAEAGENELHRAAQISQSLARCYAESACALLAQSNVAPGAVYALGCHGQTIRHRPDAGYTLQLNAPALLAELTGIRVVTDFRSRDLAAGGQGAPLVPAFHQAMFASAESARAIVNIGGISNITWLAPGHNVLGFDCGPGNMALDAWIMQQCGQPFDRDGAWAAQGKVNSRLLEIWLDDPFFQRDPPKSCGREDFGSAWLAQAAQDAQTHNVAPVHMQATLTALTVQGIVRALQRYCVPTDALFVCGGGAHNGTLMQGLVEALPGMRVERTDALGIAADWVEAQAFAWLAMRCVRGLTGNLPEATGARAARVLGAIYPP